MKPKRNTKKNTVRLVKDPNGSGLIIKFRGGLSKAVKAFNEKHKLQKLTKIDKDNHTYLAWFPKMSLARITDVGRAYYNSGFAAFAEPHVESKVTRSFTDPQYHDQWIMKNTGQFGGTPGVDIRIEQALDLIASSGINPERNICVAVLDEGVDIDHNDFRGDLWLNNFSVFGNGKNPRPPAGDHHGTGVTGIIAATQNNNTGLAGINPYCKIMAGRIYSSSSGLPPKLLDIGTGIRQAIDGGARVINMSFQVAPNQFISDVIAYGFSKNVVFCGCAGNFLTATDRAVKYPGRLESVICVGAMNNKAEWIGLNNSPYNPAEGSCYGREVDIVAPGAFLVTTANNNMYTNTFGGTSGACAIVSAVAALVLAVNPNLTNVQVRDILLSTADPLPFDAEHVGHGKVNALKAVQQAIGLI